MGLELFISFPFPRVETEPQKSYTCGPTQGEGPTA